MSILLAIAIVALLLQIAYGLEIKSLFSFTENNFQNDMAAKLGLGQSVPAQSPASKALVARGGGGGGGKGKGKGGGHGKSSECCKCSCFATDKTYDDYEDRDGYGYQDGSNYCDCSCSCGTNGGLAPSPAPIGPPTPMPIIPTVPTPSPTDPPTPAPEDPPTPTPMGPPTPAPEDPPNIGPIEPTPPPTHSPVMPTPVPIDTVTPGPVEPEACILTLGFGCEQDSAGSCRTSAVSPGVASVLLELIVENVGSESVTLASLVVAANVDPFFLNLTERVEGQILLPGNMETVSESYLIDATSQRTYNLLGTITGTTSGGEACSESDLLSFEAGLPPPPLFPTAEPATFPPTFSPVDPVTLAPVAPTTAPTQSCEIDIEAVCVPPGGAGQDCDSLLPIVTACEGEGISAATMRFNGGDCSQTFTTQTDDSFFCQDLGGGPPVTEGEQVYIRVTDVKGNGNVYFQGIVAVGEEYHLSLDLINGQDKFDINQNITIWTNANMTSMLQTVRYQTSCSSSQPLILKDRYGSNQLVEFTNPLQGNVSCFLQSTIDMTIQSPTGEDINLSSLVGVTNLGLFNFTDQVSGVLVPPEFKVTFPIVIDMTVRQRYTSLFTIVGRKVGSLDEPECRATDFLTFIAGNPFPPLFPNVEPTGTPTNSPAPTIFPFSGPLPPTNSTSPLAPSPGPMPAPNVTCITTEDGLYGNVSTNSLLVTFQYELEYKEGSIVSTIISDLEIGFVGVLLPILFPSDCPTAATRRTLKSLQRHLEDVPSSMITGVSKLPIDMEANMGATCTQQPSEESGCLKVDAFLTVYTNSDDPPMPSVEEIQNVLRQGMENGDFVKDPIVRVSYVADEEDENQ